MKKLIVIGCVGLMAGALVFGGANTAKAIKPFETEFKNVYYKPDGTAEQKALAAAIDGAKCNVCHMGTSKKERNAYGQALDKLLDKKEDAMKPDAIKAALEKVAGEKSGPAADAPTFGDLLKAGKLPGGA